MLDLPSNTWTAVVVVEDKQRKINVLEALFSDILDWAKIAKNVRAAKKVLQEVFSTADKILLILDCHFPDDVEQNHEESGPS